MMYVEVRNILIMMMTWNRDSSRLGDLRTGHFSQKSLKKCYLQCSHNDHSLDHKITLKNFTWGLGKWLNSSENLVLFQMTQMRSPATMSGGLHCL